MDILRSRKSNKLFYFLCASVVLIAGLRFGPIKSGDNVDRELPLSGDRLQGPKTEAGSAAGAPRRASFVKMELLMKTREPLSARKTASKNIFLASNKPAPSPGAKVKAPVEEKKPLPPTVATIPPIRLRLVGIIKKNETDEQGRPVRLAILAEGEQSFFARKGDRIMEQYEVLEVGENSVEIKDLVYNRTEKLELDEQ